MYELELTYAVWLQSRISRNLWDVPASVNTGHVWPCSGGLHFASSVPVALVFVFLRKGRFDNIKRNILILVSLILQIFLSMKRQT